MTTAPTRKFHIHPSVQKPSKGNKWHPELCISVEAVVKLHDEGMSTRKIATIIGYSSSYVHKMCQKAGRIRSKSEAAILARPPTSTHWRALHSQARRIVERAYGIKLLSSEHVHHKDKNPRNNELSNLEVLDSSSHARLHNPPKYVNEMGCIIPRHLRPERMKYMKAYLADYRKKAKGV